MLALLFITYFPMPKTIFPSALTSVALLKSNYLLVDLQDKKNNDFLTRGAVTGNVKNPIWHKSCPVLLSRGSVKRDESRYSFVLAWHGVNKMCGFVRRLEKHCVNGK